MGERAPFVDLLVAFGHELRSAGLAVGSGDVLTYCGAAAELDPTAARFANLSWALARSGEREESLRWIDRAIELAPDRKELRDQRARILEASSR